MIVEAAPDIRPRVPAARRRHGNLVGAKALRLDRLPRQPQACAWRLPNGLKLVITPQPHLHTANLAVFVRAGSRYESPRSNGLSHFLEHMLFRGTERYPSSYALNLAIERLGGTLSGTTHADFTAYEVSLPPESVGQGVAILANILAQPRFGDIEVEKRIVREEILEGLDEEGRDICIDDLSRSLVFGSHPLGYKITGTTPNLDGFGRRDLRTHMKRFYGASNMVFCAAGDVKTGQVFEAVQRFMGPLRAGRRAAANAPSRGQRRPRWLYVETHGSQTEVRLSFASFGESDPRALAQQLLCRVLDDGMSTRLHRRICDETGLAYDTFASTEPYEDASVFDVGATVEHTKTPALVCEVLALVRQLRERRVDDGELAKAKQRYRWDLRATLDDAETMCRHYGTHSLFDLDGRLDLLAERALNIGPDDLRDVARHVFDPRRLSVTCVGRLDRTTIRKAQQIIDRFV